MILPRPYMLARSRPSVLATSARTCVMRVRGSTSGLIQSIWPVKPRPASPSGTKEIGLPELHSAQVGFVEIQIDPHRAQVGHGEQGSVAVDERALDRVARDDDARPGGVQRQLGAGVLVDDQRVDFFGRETEVDQLLPGVGRGGLLLGQGAFALRAAFLPAPPGRPPCCSSRVASY